MVPPQFLLILLLLPLFPEKICAEKSTMAVPKPPKNITVASRPNKAPATGTTTTRVPPRAPATTKAPPKITTTTKAPSAMTTNGTLPSPPKGASYFYRDLKGPGTYEFGYHVDDEETKNIQFREETRHPNGTVTGSYGYLRPDGKMTVTNYIADEKGFRKRTKVNKQPATNGTSASPTPVPGLNLNSGTLPPQLVERVKEQYQIDLSPDAEPADVLHPNISDIINGKVPMTTNGSEPGFQVVKGFIPKEFPIVPFQLPDPDED